jgi:hypothetical protein
MVRTYDNYGYPFEPVELYNIVDDPYQTTNVSNHHPEIVERCGAYLAEWIQEQWMKGDCIPDPLQETLQARGDGLNSSAQWEHMRRYYRGAST